MLVLQYTIILWAMSTIQATDHIDQCKPAWYLLIPGNTVTAVVPQW